MTPEKAFTKWLTSVPSLEDCGEEVTINIPITLGVGVWLLTGRPARPCDNTPGFRSEVFCPSLHGLRLFQALTK